MMSTIRGDNWQLVPSNLQSNKMVNDHMAEVLGLASFQQNESVCMENISKYPGLAILLVDGFSDLMVLHNLHCLQANVYRSVPKLVALSGDGVSADCYRIDPTMSFTDLEFNTPLWRDLKSAADEVSIKILLPQEISNCIYKGKQTMVVPPLVLTTILESKSLSPAVLILALSSKFQEFDRTSMNVKACTILRPVLEYLWAVYPKKVPSTVIGLDQSSEAKEWSEKMHLAKYSTSSLTDRTSSSFCSSTSARFKSTTRSIISDHWRTPPSQRCTRKTTPSRTFQ
jgi:hypothetical protein